MNVRRPWLKKRQKNCGVGGKVADVANERRVLRSPIKGPSMAPQVEIQHRQPPSLARREGDLVGVGVAFESERRQTQFKASSRFTCSAGRLTTEVGFKFGGRSISTIPRYFGGLHTVTRHTVLRGQMCLLGLIRCSSALVGGDTGRHVLRKPALSNQPLCSR